MGVDDRRYMRKDSENEKIADGIFDELLKDKAKNSRRRKADQQVQTEYARSQYQKKVNREYRKAKIRYFLKHQLFSVFKWLCLIFILLALYTRLLIQYPQVGEWLLRFVPF